MTASAFDIPGAAQDPETAGIRSGVTLAAKPLRPSLGPGPPRPGRRPSETLP